jgi:hypothetical protein
MRSFFSRLCLAVVGIVGVVAMERPVNDLEGAELYESGVMHHRIMDMKHVSTQPEA